MPELSQRELEEMVVGKPQKPTVIFFDKARIDVEKSKAAGRRIYTTYTYVKEKQAGVTDWIAEMAQPHHIKNYPYEYQLYLTGKTDNSPSIEIIPNISPSELQELLDMRLGTVQRLAEVTDIPKHLDRIWRSAKVIQAVLTEQKNGTEESIDEERAGSGSVQNVHALDRQDNNNDVGQPRPSGSDTGDDRELAQRVQTSGRFNGNSAKLSDDWSISFTMR